MVDSAVPRKVLRCDDPGQLNALAGDIIEFSQGLKVWLFEGQMGAGKTTLIKAICLQLGVVDVVNSPTYAIVNEYEDSKGATLYHFDFYRLEDPYEAFDIGVDEYLDSGNYCFVEWPSKVETILPESGYMTIDITLDRETRVIELTRNE